MLPKTLNHSAKTKVGDTNEAGAPARMQQAIALVERSMRPSLVARITAVAPRVLRELHQQIHGCRPAFGQFPRTGGILRSQRSRATALVFWALYRAFGSAAVKAGSDVDALLSASPLPEADRKCCCVPQVGAHRYRYHRSVPGGQGCNDRANPRVAAGSKRAGSQGRVQGSGCGAYRDRRKRHRH